MIFGRRERPPASLVQRLDRDERIVSWARTRADAVAEDAVAEDAVAEKAVAATNRGLWVPPGRRIGWHLVDKAVWRDGVLAITEAELVDDLLLRDRPPLALPLAEPRDLPPTVRRRVEASVVRSEVLPVTGGAARFVARRISGRDGVTWWARLEPGTPDTEWVRAAVRARRDELAARWAADQPQ